MEKYKGNIREEQNIQGTKMYGTKLGCAMLKYVAPFLSPKYVVHLPINPHK